MLLVLVECDLLGVENDWPRLEPLRSTAVGDTEVVAVDIADWQSNQLEDGPVAATRMGPLMEIVATSLLKQLKG